MGYEKALNDYIAATNTHDFKNVRRLLDDKAIYWFSNKSCNTIDEIGKYFENAWNTIKNEVYRATNVHWLVEEENTATCIYTYEFEGYYEEEFIQGSGRATNVFKKNSDGNWRLIHEHLSTIK
ncbi:YybH family protein [Paucisalibacillus globulus]|uniref:YybH family protein n=1 Tax=Paucisalibacillus globulus TaxID=351095 RepID=UPI000BB6C8DC|nr:nuclear transport factor 2 family protein [Paucisalibacillus globulus]